jgi:DNA-binding SARP family transcriptional activator
VSQVKVAAGVEIQVRMLGPLTVSREGRASALPASRKARALLAYLALAPLASNRSQLCELLWDAPSDPRGELRWCLSKIRGVVGGARVSIRGDAVRLDLADCAVDALEIERVARAGIGTLAPEQARALAAQFGGTFLEGLEIDRSPAFSGWLIAQRRRFRGYHAALLEHLAKSVADDEALTYLEKWVELAPFDLRAHQLLLGWLARRGRIREGEEHLAATARLFDAEVLDCAPLREAWQSARGVALPASSAQEAAADPAASRRASIAVMPFVDRSSPGGSGGGHADGLVQDVTTRLAQLRSLFVIAQATARALHERNVGPEEAGRMLNVDYIVSGAVQQRGARLAVTVELAETRSARIVWAESFNHKLDDAFLILDQIGNRIVASIASEVERLERNRAILAPPSSLGAWEAHHRGLWHMYRYTRADNERARHFFEVAVRLDPTFARAYSGLSFTYFQDVFQSWGEREAAIDRAFATAEQSLIADERDPAAHWAMGRALWLRGQHERSVVELDHCVDLSPNFALGHYTLAFVQSQAGDARAAISAADYSRRLSPFDPLLLCMLGVRAMALVRLGEFEEAARWAVNGASRPNAFTHIRAIAACSLALTGKLDEARVYAAEIRRTIPQYTIADFLGSFHFDAHGASLFRQGAKRIEMA